MNQNGPQHINMNDYNHTTGTILFTSVYLLKWWLLYHRCCSCVSGVEVCLYTYWYSLSSSSFLFPQLNHTSKIDFESQTSLHSWTGFLCLNKISKRSGDPSPWCSCFSLATWVSLMSDAKLDLEFKKGEDMKWCNTTVHLVSLNSLIFMKESLTRRIQVSCSIHHGLKVWITCSSLNQSLNAHRNYGNKKIRAQHPFLS